MTQQDKNKVVTLDDLLALVESAARRLESLQAANAALEREAASLRRDAAWCRWFRNKYQNSIFYSNIELDFQKEYLGEDLSDNDSSSGPAS